jgi:hypothetical protein
LATIFFFPVRAIFSVSPRILQRCKSLEIVNSLIFKLCDIKMFSKRNNRNYLTKFEFLYRSCSRNYSLLISTKMAKHGKELSDDTKKRYYKTYWEWVLSKSGCTKLVKFTPTPSNPFLLIFAELFVEILPQACVH